MGTATRSISSLSRGANERNNLGPRICRSAAFARSRSSPISTSRFVLRPGRDRFRPAAVVLHRSRVGAEKVEVNVRVINDRIDVEAASGERREADLRPRRSLRPASARRRGSGDVVSLPPSTSRAETSRGVGCRRAALRAESPAETRRVLERRRGVRAALRGGTVGRRTP